MKFRLKKSFTTAIFFQITVVIILTVLVLGYLWINKEYEVFSEQSEEMKNEYINNQKSLVKSQVNGTVDYINYMRKQTEDKLKANIKERTYEEYSVAMNIYNSNKNTKSDEEIKKMINDALRNVRFNNGRGYYFIDSLSGYAVLYPTNPDLEGKNLLELQDQKGNYALKDEINLVKKQNEGFITDYWTNPEYNDNKVYPKITFVKKFEPYNWYLGTGEYINDVEQDVEKETLARISTIRFGNSTQGYVFVHNYNGLELCNGMYPSYVGKNLLKLTDIKGTKVVEKQINIAKNNPDGGFLIHYWKEPNSNDEFQKMTYVRAIPELKWVVGSGIEMKQIEKLIDNNKKAMQVKIYKEITSICLILVGALIIAFSSTRYLTDKSRRNFELFTDFLYNSTKGNEKLDVDKIHYSEFKSLVRAANEMIEERNSTAIKIRDRNVELRKMLITDGLTKLYNHKYIYERLEIQVKKSQKINEKFCVIMFDIDFFKKINDTFGHQVGDEVLERVSKIIKDNIKGKEIAGRYGGEEFILILPNVNLNEGYEFAENIRKQVMISKFHEDDLKVTFSGGVAEYSGETALKLVKKADEKLYEAKKNGRNRIEK
ncbi:diguanylate cyclase (GGDEF) domain-containing protein [Clostridium acidisoli DSM 12555]|uniref:Diguanylate cyclase (GGDEF) domain-containing protein n=1 Tax=Clostridium acidisoli DSM 12555 TaxID=1121291 RepID=A0A1W1XN38_9CLOT|nr:cache domain-containing protein [Clostridium acidisoli]SMC25326.1 diguanylate cyclase (GGDEF) domain-containing protein [Clostridium acidisoli DSM 12555]